jgi:hypothetical protein
LGWHAEQTTVLIELLVPVSVRQKTVVTDALESIRKNVQ